MNGAQIDWGLLFLSSSGRLSRSPFLVGLAAIMAVLLLYDNAVPLILQGLNGGDQGVGARHIKVLIPPPQAFPRRLVLCKISHLQKESKAMGEIDRIRRR